MKELYWIERLDNIQVLFIVLAFISIVWMLFSFIIPWSESFDEDDYKEKGIYKARKVSGTLLVISILILVFVPNSKGMYRIIGIGGTIDYIRQNDTAKQLPDKCIKALDLFLDKVIGEDKDNK